MDNGEYFTEELTHAISVRDSMLTSGYINIQPAVYNLNANIRRLEALISEYTVCKTELDEIATRKQEFGSNRTAIISHNSRLTQIEESIKTIVAAINKIENNVLKESGIMSNANNFGNVGIVNNSINAFPDCIPASHVEIPNNLYLIKDKELEEYYTMETEFLKVCRKIYDEMINTGMGYNYASNLSKLSMIIKSSEQVYNTIIDLIEKKNYYNETYMNIPIESAQYEEYCAYPDTYNEALSIIVDIYNMNASKFNEITRSLNKSF